MIKDHFIKLSFFLLLFSILAPACTQHPGKEKTKQTATPHHRKFPPGKLINRVTCSPDTAYTYALYLPGNYTADQKFPVLFFFDAHKRGKLPVHKYKSLADKYGYILAGSYNSTNGQSQKEMDKAIRMMMDDVGKKFNIDPERIYTGGFSGGARVAAYAALFKRKITGVVGCAAGFPQIQSQPHTGFAYIGMVGDKDFNYLEMKNLDRSLQGANMTPFIRVYNGKHDWPPPEIMNDAFVFFQLDAMRKKTIPVDVDLIGQFKKQLDDSITVASENRDWLGLAGWLKKVAVFLNGVSNVTAYQQNLTKLTNNTEYQKHLDEELKLEKTEHQLQQSYVKAMENRNKSWWISDVKKRIAASENAGNKAEVLMNKRLLNYLSLVSYMYATNALRSNNTTAADKYLMIYQTVDPENPEVYYLKAVRFSVMNSNNKALKALEKAAEHGFKEPDRMAKDKHFSAFRQMPAFNKILEQIEQNARDEE